MLTVTYSIADQHFQKGKSLGILNVSLHLLEALAAHPEAVSLRVLSNSSLSNRLGRSPLNVQNHDEAIAGRWRRLLWDQVGLYRAARSTGDHWLFLPKGFASFLKKPPVRLATYMHDAMIDFYQRNHPHDSPLFENTYFRRAARASLRDASIVFTNTDFVSSEIRRLAGQYEIPCPPVITAGIGFTRFAAPPGGPKREAIVLLTSRWPHKKTAMAVEYLVRWQKVSGFDGPIVLAGSLPKGISASVFPRAQHRDRLIEEDYQALLCSSRVLIFSSEYEGFGMPPVEAAIAGACPVYSDLPSTRSVMQDRGCPFQNDSFDSFRSAMDIALKISSQQIGVWAGQLLKCHNWNDVAERVIEGMKSAERSFPAPA